MLNNDAHFYQFRPSSSFRSKGQASEYENMDSDIPPEDSEQNHHAAAAVLKSPPLKPSKIPRLVSSPAKSKPQPTSKVSSALVKSSFSRSVTLLVQLLQQQHPTPHSPPTKPGRSSNRDSEQKEIDEFEEEERRLLELDQQVREFGCVSLFFVLNA